MCGRYSITTASERIRELFGLEGPMRNLRPRYNLAPTEDAPVVRIRDGERKFVMLRWGLVPHWSTGPDSCYSMINNRAETVDHTPACRDAFRRRRRLIPADGFYEWKAGVIGKQPYRITMKDGAPFASAGLWERWGKGAEAIESFTIIVTDANDALRPIHDRMPAILAPGDYAGWLDGSAGKELLRPYPSEAMAAYPVSCPVNSPATDDPECVDPA